MPEVKNRNQISLGRDVIVTTEGTDMAGFIVADHGGQVVNVVAFSEGGVKFHFEHIPHATTKKEGVHAPSVWKFTTR